MLLAMQPIGLGASHRGTLSTRRRRERRDHAPTSTTRGHLARGMTWQTLTAARFALYRYTRPAFALAGVGSIVVADVAMAHPQEAKPSKLASTSSAESILERVALLPMGAVGLAGVVAVLRGQAGLVWLGHSYERWAWSTAFGSLPVAAAVAAAGCSSGTSSSGIDSAAAEQLHYLLAPAAGALLAAVAGERLGSAVGRVLLPALTGIGALSAAAAVQGDSRGERVASDLQTAALLLLPALHVTCLPVYTLSGQSGLGLAWFHAAAAWSTLDDSPKAVQRALLAVGAASLLRTLCRRAPICHF